MNKLSLKLLLIASIWFFFSCSKQDLRNSRMLSKSMKSLSKFSRHSNLLTTRTNRTITTKFQTITLDNFSNPDNTGTVTASGTWTFSNNVVDAAVAFQQWSMSFSDGSPHEIQIIGGKISNVKCSGKEVTFDMLFTLTNSDINEIRNIGFPRGKALIIANCEDENQ